MTVAAIEPVVSTVIKTESTGLNFKFQKGSDFKKGVGQPKGPVNSGPGGGGGGKGPASPKGGSGGQKGSGGRSKKSSGAFKGFVTPGKSHSGSHNLLIAEFLLCAVIIFIDPILTRKPDNGHIYRPNEFVRLSACFLLFFTLALVGTTKQGSRFASAFGALVTLGVLYNASDSLKVIGSIFTNASTKGHEVTAAQASDDEVTTASFTPVGYSGSPITNAAATESKAAQNAAFKVSGGGSGTAET